jgi:hypothetical protein
MIPTLSRRIARVFYALDLDGNLPPSLRARFVEATETAKSFAEFPPDLQKIVIATESKYPQIAS